MLLRVQNDSVICHGSCKEWHGIDQFMRERNEVEHFESCCMLCWFEGLGENVCDLCGCRDVGKNEESALVPVLVVAARASCRDGCEAAGDCRGAAGAY